MSYEARELSAHDGQPVECYEFFGTHLAYRYTTADEPRVIDGVTFEPLPMGRSGVKVTTPTDTQAEVTLDIPADIPMVKEYAFQITPPALYLRMYRMHRGDDPNSEFAIYYQGPVTSIEVTEDDRAEVSATSELGAILSANVPSVYYQAPCNHVIFGPGCGISRALHSVATTVIAHEGNSIAVASVGSFPDGYFVGGEVLHGDTGERRMIVGQALENITINFPFSRNLTGESVEVAAGCDHAWKGDCKNKYDNTERHGGHPLIPSVNIFTDGF